MFPYEGLIIIIIIIIIIIHVYLLSTHTVYTSITTCIGYTEAATHKKHQKDNSVVHFSSVHLSMASVIQSIQ